MKSVTLTVVIVLVMFGAMACMKDDGAAGKSSVPSASPAPSAAATVDEFATVRPIFKEHCEKCHGPTGDGGPVTVDGKKLRVPSLKAGHALKHKDEDFVDQMMNGGDGMPAFKSKLQPAEIDGLVKFIRKEFQKK
jgi:mono/diheme cytochrome c family protein